MGYGLRFSTEIYGSQREKTVSTNTYRNIVFLYRNIREFTGECHLGILLSSSLLVLEGLASGGSAPDRSAHHRSGRGEGVGDG